MGKIFWLISGIVVLGFVLRAGYCLDLPLSGDEGISLLQAAGKAADYDNFIPQQPTPVGEIRKLMEYSPEYGPGKVVESMTRAGMHPPLYYLLLHYVVKFFGNELLFLRLLSILFSSLSILILYFLGRDLFNRTAGMSAAFLFAISPYGIHFSNMVRPYPMVMFLSLLSTWLLVKYLHQVDRLRKNILLVLYIFTVLSGFYTIYIFAFVFVFQMTYLLFQKPLHPGTWLKVFLITAAICVFYLPWLPSFITQMKIVNEGEYYFHGYSAPLKMLEYIFSWNFTEHLPGQYAWYKFLILALVGFILFKGILAMLKSKTGRILIVSFTAYAASNYLADLVMKSVTINVPKFLFFLVPGFMLFLGAGICCFKKTFMRAAALGSAAVLLSINAFFLFRNPVTTDGPLCIKELTSLVSGEDYAEKNLVILGTTQRRLVLSFVYPLENSNMDTAITDDFEAVQEMLENLTTSEYTQIQIAAFFSDPEEWRQTAGVIQEAVGNPFEMEFHKVLPCADMSAAFMSFRKQSGN